jgi:microsomal dipeptidase-like Zn-dependent dipeptidase
MWTALLLSLAFATEIDHPSEVHVQIDWQAHPAMHIPWWMFGKGLTDRPLKRRTWRHQFKQTVSAHTLGDSEVRIFLAAAMAAERAKNPRQARRLILKQLAYVEAFVGENPAEYVLARTPAEAREALASTDKMVVVHSIEGGHHLLWDEGDARFWAEQGVALMTLIHLRDKELGGSAILEGGIGRMINPGGARARKRGERRGLSDHGKRSMVALDEAGVLVDLTHMSPAAVEDALELAEQHGISPVMTHSVLASVVHTERSVSDDQLVQLYRLGGVFALGLSGLDTDPSLAVSEPDTGPCAGSVEAWAWHHQRVQAVLLDRAPDIFDEPALTGATLTEVQKTRLATGWSSDWNGWTSHSRPVFGRQGCHREIPPDASQLDVRGLAHPGLLPEHWERVGQQGVALEPMLRSAERFLQLWEQARQP